MSKNIPRATLARLPLYLQYVRTVESEMISATAIAWNLSLGEVLVRKDLNMISREGQPKVGYPVQQLKRDLENALGIHQKISTVIVGAGEMGTALMDYDGFQEYGLEIAAAFDHLGTGLHARHGDLNIYDMSELPDFCNLHDTHTGILTVPSARAQEAADQMIAGGITAILNFAPCYIRVPAQVTVQQYNVALALARLNVLVSQGAEDNQEARHGRQII